MRTTVHRSWVSPLLMGALLVAFLSYEAYLALNTRPELLYADDWTPLAEAAKDGDTELVRELIGQGADLEVFSGDFGSEETALGWAALEGNLDTALVLIEAGANVNAGNHGNWTPLMSAAYYGHPEMVKLLLDHGANPKVRDYMGKTAADWAHGEHRQEIRAILKGHL